MQENAWTASAGSPLLGYSSVKVLEDSLNCQRGALPMLPDAMEWGRATTMEARAVSPGWSRLACNISVALVASFMGATDGVSLGSLIFPSSEEFPNTEYRALGMSIGLLTAFVSNLGGLVGSQLEFAVGGVNIPTVILLASYFRTLGPDKCPTILAMTLVASAAGGVMLWLVGRFRIARIAKACPFVVYGGFMAGTGVALLQCGLNLMCPAFVSLFDPESVSALLQEESMPLWLPGTLAGASLFAIQTAGLSIPGVPDELVVPTMLVLLSGLFFIGLRAMSLHLEDARSSGWLFDLQLPSEPVFYHVWTKQVSGLPAVDWTSFLAPGFWLAILNSSLISALTVVMNIYGCARTTCRRIDIDREIMLHGAYNIGSALVSGMPCSMVMSFSVTCKLLGAKGRQFQVILMFVSLLTFVFGAYILAVLPKLIPGTMLIWLGLELSRFWVWDAKQFMQLYEYLLIWIMILLYIVVGSGFMMIFGILTAVTIVIKQSSQIPILASRANLAEQRSAVIRTVCDRDYLMQCSEKAEIWAVGTPYLYFASVRQLIELFESFPPRVQSKNPARQTPPDEASQQHAPAHVILDLALVRCLELTAVSAFMEALDVAAELECTFIIARAHPAVCSQLQKFFADSLLRITPELMRLADELDFDIQADRKKPVLLYADTLDMALQWVEEALLAVYVPRPGHCRGGVRHLHDVHSALSEVTSRTDPLWGLWEDFHIRLGNLTPAYSHLEFVLRLRQFLQIRHVDKDEHIYKALFFSRKHSDVSVSHALGESPPPLVWLLHGEVEHVWNKAFDLKGVLPFQQGDRHPLDERWEIASVSSEATCAGPFRTVRAFLAGTAHPGILRATKRSQIVVLTW
eukprot:CAMPEP_0117564134 /NCGR_PEP_ID=MMETSP0784-20121206/55869_1 /TAXON_ID=39447 /ORGANISM="" /LENGTH=858 /DNA_ID=CAMNT_0005361833 /DNA_START=90 /DNA_END=2663 /DNA_ORIENTATION=+